MLLAARALARLPRLVARQAHDLERLAGPPLAGAAVDAPLLQPVGDVLEHRQVREERVGLEDRVDVALVRRPRAHVLAAEQERALVGVLEPGDQAQGRRLAAAGRTEQREKLTVPDAEAEVVHRGDVAVALRHPPELDVEVHQ